MLLIYPLFRSHLQEACGKISCFILAYMQICSHMCVCAGSIIRYGIYDDWGHACFPSELRRKTYTFFICDVYFFFPRWMSVFSVERDRETYVLSSFVTNYLAIRVINVRGKLCDSFFFSSILLFCFYTSGIYSSWVRDCGLWAWGSGFEWLLRQWNFRFPYFLRRWDK